MSGDGRTVGLDARGGGMTDAIPSRVSRRSETDADHTERMLALLLRDPDSFLSHMTADDIRSEYLDSKASIIAARLVADYRPGRSEDTA